MTKQDSAIEYTMAEQDFLYAIDFIGQQYINIQMNAYNVHSDRVKSLLNTDLDFKILFVLNVWQLVLAGDIQFLLPDR